MEARPRRSAVTTKASRFGSARAMAPAGSRGAARRLAAGIPKHVLERCIRGSLPFGVYESGLQVGFARVATDLASYGYLMDVFVLESHRGRGLAKWLMECILAHPSLQGFRRWGPGHARRPRPVCAVRLPPACASGENDGNRRPGYLPVREIIEQRLRDMEPAMLRFTRRRTPHALLSRPLRCRAGVRLRAIHADAQRRESVRPRQL